MLPRRFGKSLLLSTLMNYYDVNRADDFEKLFGDLSIGQKPTPLHNTYLVMRWDFSKIRAAGSIEQIENALNDHINDRIERYNIFYQDHLQMPIRINSANALSSLESLMAVTDVSNHKLYLFIDEYDNFANEVMMGQHGHNQQRYIELVKGEGIFKTFFKNVKSAGSGDGLDRVFMTGVSPVVLNDVTSGANTFEDVTWRPNFNALCGFHGDEVQAMLEKVAEHCGFSDIEVQDILEQMRRFYNGSRFVTRAPGRNPVEDLQNIPKIYNPTLVFYLLKELQDSCEYPNEMLDGNLEPDSHKLTYISHRKEGQQLMLDALDEETAISVYTLQKKFGVKELINIHYQRESLAVLLCYLGALTVGGRTPTGQIQLEIPNLVMRRLYADRILEMLTVDDLSKRNEAREAASQFFINGDIEPLCNFVESYLLSVYDNRDYREFNELTLKTLFMPMLHFNSLYIMDSEPEIMRRYGDLLMLLRPGMYYDSVCEILIEFKYLPLKKMTEKVMTKQKKESKKWHRLTEEDIKAKSTDELLRMDVVEGEFDDARTQLRDYRQKLNQKYSNGLRLQTYTVVGIGFQRVLWEEVSS